MAKKEVQADNRVFSDFDRAKETIWGDYDGFMINFRGWSQYRSLNSNSILYRSGIIKYYSTLYYQIKYLLFEMEGKFNKKDFDRFIGLVPGSVDFSDADFYFLVDFIEQFMVTAGFKKVTYEVDNRQPLDKLREKMITK